MARSGRAALGVAAAVCALAGTGWATAAKADPIDLACSPAVKDILALDVYLSLDPAAGSASQWLEGHARSEAVSAPLTTTDTQAMFQTPSASFTLDRQTGALTVTSNGGPSPKLFNCRRLAQPKPRLF